MLMAPPPGGDTFNGYSGFTYTSADGGTLEIGPGDLRQAFFRGWVISGPIGGSDTEVPSAPGAQPVVIE